MIQGTEITLLLTFLVLGASSQSSIHGSSCHTSGVLPDSYDCTRFLVCAGAEDDAVVVDVVKCPSQYAFSAEERTCVPADRETGCAHSHLRVTRATVPSGSCKKSGAYCQDCDRLVICASVNGSLRALSNISCGGVEPELSCNPTSMACSPNVSVCPTGGAFEFVCLAPGLYPDPSNCKRYHYCSSNLTHITDTCNGDYEPDTGTCTDIYADMYAEDSFTPNKASVPRLNTTSTSSQLPSLNATSPSQNATLPSQNATSPSQNTTSPSQNATSPSQNATSPSQNDTANVNTTRQGRSIQRRDITPDCNKPVAAKCAEDPSPAPFVVHQSFYRVCLPEAGRNGRLSYKVAVLECPDKQQFSVDTLSCQFPCVGNKGRFPDPDDCTSFYQCSQGVAIRKTCVAGLAYNSTKKICDPKNLVACRQPDTSDTTTSLSLNTTSSGITANTAPSTTTSVITANTTSSITTSVITANTASSSKTSVITANTASSNTTSVITAKPASSTTSSTSQTPVPPSREFQCPREGRFVDRSNCRAYMWCYWSWYALRKSTITCPWFMKFDSKLEMCMFGFC